MPVSEYRGWQQYLSKQAEESKSKAGGQQGINLNDPDSLLNGLVYNN